MFILRNLKVLQRSVVAVLLFSLLGCSSSRPGVVPGWDEGRAAEESRVPVEVGSSVRVYLVDGEVALGRVVEVSDAELQIRGAWGQAPEVRTLSAEQISSIEVVDAHNGRALALLPATVVVLFGVVVVGLLTGNVQFGGS